MVLYVVLIAPKIVLGVKIISECSIVEKGQLIPKLLVSELVVLDQRSNKEAAN